MGEQGGAHLECTPGGVEVELLRVLLEILSSVLHTKGIHTACSGYYWEFSEILKILPLLALRRGPEAGARSAPGRFEIPDYP